MCVCVCVCVCVCRSCYIITKLKENNKENYKLSYEEIKKIIEFEIDHSFLTYKKEKKNLDMKFIKYL